MKASEQLKHWSSMANLTSSKESVLSVDQLDEIAKAFRVLEQEAQKNLEGALAWQQRAEAAEADSSYMGGGARYWHDEYCSQQHRLVAKIVLLESKLAENGLCCIPTEEEKKLISEGDFTPEELWGVGGVKSCPKCFGKQKHRPAPAINLAELVPLMRDLESERQNGFLGQAIGWNDCRAAILRKIEESK